MNQNPEPISGIHHVTAIASDPQRNLNFYAGVLGQRLVKRTVNFDDPGAYHFYFADYSGTPGTLITFFPWPNARRGVQGSGEIIATAWVAPLESLAGWEARLRAAGVAVGSRQERFGEPVVTFTDPDGMTLELVGRANLPSVELWPNGPLAPEAQLRGFQGVTLQVRDAEASAVLLRDRFGWREVGREGARLRLEAEGGAPGRVVDLLERRGLPEGRMGAGTVHHVAFRTPDDSTQARWRTLLGEDGFRVTPMRDRQYFHSIYFREPNGVLYEIATDPPGMEWDESLARLGATLKLPPWLEPQRAEIEENLPRVHAPG